MILLVLALFVFRLKPALSEKDTVVIRVFGIVMYKRKSKIHPNFKFVIFIGQKKNSEKPFAEIKEASTVTTVHTVQHVTVVQK